MREDLQTIIPCFNTIYGMFVDFKLNERRFSWILYKNLKFIGDVSWFRWVDIYWWYLSTINYRMLRCSTRLVQRNGRTLREGKRYKQWITSKIGKKKIIKVYMSHKNKYSIRFWLSTNIDICLSLSFVSDISEKLQSP